MGNIGENNRRLKVFTAGFIIVFIVAIGAYGQVYGEESPSTGSDPVENQINIKAASTLDGMAPADGIMTYKLTDQQGITVESVKNTGDEVIFSKLAYSEPGQYIYFIQTTGCDETNVQWDAKQYKVIVEVSNRDGHLIAAQKNTPVFENHIGDIDVKYKDDNRPEIRLDGKETSVFDALVLYKDGKEAGRVGSQGITVKSGCFSSGENTYLVTPETKIAGGYLCGNDERELTIIVNNDGTAQLVGEKSIINVYTTPKIYIRGVQNLNGIGYSPGHFSIEGASLSKKIYTASTGKGIIEAGFYLDTDMEMNKTYILKVHQEDEDDKDMIYDKKVKTVEVTAVERDGKVIVEQSGDDLIFEDFSVPELQFAGQGILDGSRKGGYSFSLEGEGVSVSERSVSDHNGIINFNFKIPGMELNKEYSFNISQHNNNDINVIYDNQIKSVKVKVVNDEGKLKIIKYGDNISFKNYTKPTYQINGRAQLDGKGVDNYSFQLVGNDSADYSRIVRWSSSNGVNRGRFTFEKLTFDGPGIYNYVVEETKQDDNDIVYDLQKKKIKIKVSEDNSGRLQAVRTGDKLVFNNYRKIKYVISGKNLLDSDGIMGNVMISAGDVKSKKALTSTNSISDGKGKFGFSLKGLGPGIYKYIITSKPGKNRDVVYDNEPVSVTVTVLPGQEGKLVASQSSPVSFRHYRKATAYIDGKVLLDNEEFTGKTDTSYFSFRILPVSENAKNTVSTNETLSDGSDFGFGIHGLAPGIYTYKIEQIDRRIRGIDQETQGKIITAEVKEDNVTGKLRVDINGDRTFRNKTKKGQYKISGKVYSDGKVAEVGRFSFQLSDNEGRIIDTVQNDTKSDFSFKTLTLDKPGTYHYKLKEIEKKGDQGFILDDRVYNIILHVTEREHDLTVEPNIEGDKLIFNNKTIEVKSGFKRGQISVKIYTYKDGKATQKNRAAIVGLYKDARYRQLIAKKKVDTRTGTVAFKNLEEGVYYPVELNSTGAPIIGTGNVKKTGQQSGEEKHQVDYSARTATVAESDPYETVSVVDKHYTANYYSKNISDNGKINVTVKVTRNGEKWPTEKKFYVALFTDKNHVEKVSEVKTLYMDGQAESSVLFGNLKKNKNYYLAETDKNGNPITYKSIEASDIVIENRPMSVNGEKLFTVIENKYVTSEHKEKNIGSNVVKAESLNDNSSDTGESRGSMTSMYILIAITVAALAAVSIAVKKTK